MEDELGFRLGARVCSTRGGAHELEDQHGLDKEAAPGRALGVGPANGFGCCSVHRDGMGRAWCDAPSVVVDGDPLQRDGHIDSAAGFGNPEGEGQRGLRAADHEE